MTGDRQPARSSSSASPSGSARRWRSRIVSLTIPHGSYCCLLGPSRLRQDHDPAHDRRPRDADQRATSGSAARSSSACRRSQRGTAMMFQSYALFPHLQRARQCGLRPEDARRRQGRAPRAAREMLSQGAARAVRRPHAGPALGRPAAAGGAGPRADHQSARAAARRAAVGARRVSCGCACAASCGGVQKELGITFIHVTHTQLEAIALADTVVVMDQGRIEQAAAAAGDLRRAAQRLCRPLHGRPERLPGPARGRIGRAGARHRRERRPLRVPAGRPPAQ